MKKIEIIKEFNAPKLYDELLQKNLITPVQDNGMSRLQGDFLFVEDESDVVAIQSTIDTHDPTPLPPQPTEFDKMRIESAQANAELFEMMLSMVGGM